MKIVKYMFAWLLFFSSIGCSSENEEEILPIEDRCEDNTATLSENIIPIINTNCAVSGCHVSGTGRVDFTVKENIIQNANQIRSFTQNGMMPPPEASTTLTTQQRDDIFCWVENGAQDN